MAFIFKYLSTYGLTILLVQPFSFYLIVQSSNRKLIWFTSVIFLIINSYFLDLPHTEIENQDELDYKDKLDLTLIIFAWTNIRCISYFLDAIDNEKMKKMSVKNLIKLFSYLFYLPLLYHGPIIIYSNFRNSGWHSESTKEAPFATRLMVLVIQLLRYGFWWFIMELILHYLYLYCMMYQLEFLDNVNLYALYGVGYLIGQLFQVKYVVFYGISCCITHFELNCLVPAHPKCISRIYLYSDMWKYFDKGLYIFMIKYIYKPCAKEAGKLLSSLVCFTYVFIWHGLRPHILIWSLLNYIGVTMESFGKEIMKIESIKKKYIDNMDDRIFRRIKCMLASPLLIMSHISFFFYQGGKEFGDIYLNKLFFGNYFNPLDA